VATCNYTTAKEKGEGKEKKERGVEGWNRTGKGKEKRMGWKWRKGKAE